MQKYSHVDIINVIISQNFILLVIRKLMKSRIDKSRINNCKILIIISYYTNYKRQGIFINLMLKVFIQNTSMRVIYSRQFGTNNNFSLAQKCNFQISDSREIRILEIPENSL